jgi:hypothetical protein
MTIRDPKLTEARRLIADDKRQRAKARKTARAPKPKRAVKGREKDPKFIAWLHKDIPCIGCEIEQNPTWPVVHPIEAAHQRHAKGRGGMLGRRPDDADTCPLCEWHHRTGPNCCDPANRKFWERLGVDVGAFCRALFDAFKNGRPGDEVVDRFVKQARETEQ